MRPSGTEATVFGLDVRADRPLPFLETARAAPTGRPLEVSLVEDGVEAEWPEGVELISDERGPGGAVSFQIGRSDEAGYRFRGPDYGSSVLSPDGRRVRGRVGGGGIDAWQRFLVAQVLPFAAVLQGLEVLHAGAVVLDGEGVAIVGPSGAGKTSLALALCRGGAEFLADDVLALERVGEELIGHAGAPVAGIDRAEGERLLREGEGAPEALAANARERVARMPVRAGPAPLRAIFFLDRRPDGPAEPRFEPAADPQLLLSSTFNLLLADPGRLAGLLDVCALAARGRVERILVGPATNASELGVAVERRLGSGA